MGGKPWSASEDATIRESYESLSAREISALVGRSVRAVTHRVETLGLSKGPKLAGKQNAARWESALKDKLGESPVEWVRRKYLDEEMGIEAICAASGINTRSVMRLMREGGVKARTPTEAFALMYKRNPRLLDSFIRNGHTPEAERKKALFRQTHWQKFTSPNERKWLAALNGAGLFPVPQLAVEQFNIDFAFPDEMLAVELDPRWHRSPIKRPMDARKDARLGQLGWKVLRLDDRTSFEFNIHKVSSALKSCAATHPR